MKGLYLHITPNADSLAFKTLAEKHGVDPEDTEALESFWTSGRDFGFALSIPIDILKQVIVGDVEETLRNIREMESIDGSPAFDPDSCVVSMYPNN